MFDETHAQPGCAKNRCDSMGDGMRMTGSPLISLRMFVLDKRNLVAVLRRWRLALRRTSLTTLRASSLEELQESGLGVVLDVRLGGCFGGSGRDAEDGVDARDGLHYVEINASTFGLLGPGVDNSREEDTDIRRAAKSVR